MSYGKWINAHQKVKNLQLMWNLLERPMIKKKTDARE